MELKRKGRFPMLKESQAYTVLGLICEVNISIADSAEAI
jgi:hypothetical protein